MTGRFRAAVHLPLLAACLLTALVAVLLAVRAASAGPLWRDEAGAVAVATLPSWGEVLARFPHEAFPLLFPATVRGVLALSGDSDQSLRWLGAAVGAALLAVFWLGARSAGGLPLISLTLFAPHAALLVLFTGVRGYGMGALFLVLTLAGYASLLVRPRWGSVVATTAAAMFAVHSVLHAAPLVAALAVAAAIAAARDRRWRLAALTLAIAGLAALTLLPYRGPLAAAMPWQRLIVDPSPLTPGRVLRAAIELLDDPGRWVPVAWLAVGGLVWVLSLSSLRRGGDEGGAVASSARLFRVLVVPVACLFQYGFFVALGYLPRGWYFVPLLALLASALDGLLAPLLRGRAVTAAAGAALVLAAVLAPPAWREVRLRSTNVDLIAAELERRAQPRDLVLVQPWFYGVSFQRHYRGPAQWMSVPPLADLRFHRYDLLQERMTEPAPLAAVVRVARRTLRGGHRVWLVGPYDPPPPGSSPPRLPPAPGGPYGWADAPYVDAWSQQLAAWLHERAARTASIAVRRQGVSGVENLPLRSFAGWRRAASPGPPRVEPSAGPAPVAAP